MARSHGRTCKRRVRIFVWPMLPMRLCCCSIGWKTRCICRRGSRCARPNTSRFRIASARLPRGVQAGQDRAYPLIAFDHSGRNILATFTFANIVRGAFQACHLGYGVAAPMQGQGLMLEILRPGIAWALGELGLHRVMANYMPRNERSAKLLAQLGFEREGYAKRYLQIAGVWEDHILTALVRPDV